MHHTLPPVHLHWTPGSRWGHGGSRPATPRQHSATSGREMCWACAHPPASRMALMLSCLQWHKCRQKGQVPEHSGRASAGACVCVCVPRLTCASTDIEASCQLCTCGCASISECGAARQLKKKKLHGCLHMCLHNACEHLLLHDVCACVCMCVHMCACVCVCVGVRVCVQLHTCMCVWNGLCPLWTAQPHWECHQHSQHSQPHWECHH